MMARASPNFRGRATNEVEAERNLDPSPRLRFVERSYLPIKKPESISIATIPNRILSELCFRILYLQAEKFNGNASKRVRDLPGRINRLLMRYRR